MVMNKRLLLFLACLPLLAACGRAGPVPQPVPVTPAVPTATPLAAQASATPAPQAGETAVPQPPEEEIRLEYATAFTQIPGLYLPAGSYFAGTGRSAFIAAGLPCAGLLSALDSGEWRLVHEVTYPWLGGDDLAYLALLERGDQQLLVRAVEQALEPPTDEGEEASPPPRQGGSKTCTASLAAVPAVEVEASGVYQAAGIARQIPLHCGLEGEKGVSLDLIYEGPGDLRISFEAIFPLAPGEYPLAWDVEDEADWNKEEEDDPLAGGVPEVILTLTRSGRGFFEVFAAAAAGDGEAEEFSGDEFFPYHEDFSGLLVVHPFDRASWTYSGEVVLNNLEHEQSGRMQNIRLGFSCSLPPAGTP